MVSSSEYMTGQYKYIASPPEYMSGFGRYLVAPDSYSISQTKYLITLPKKMNFKFKITIIDFS